jgi:hypothetical protein
MGDCVSPLPLTPLPKTRIWGGQFAVLIFTKKSIFHKKSLRVDFSENKITLQNILKDFSKGVGVVLKSRVLQKNFFRKFSDFHKRPYTIKGRLMSPFVLL